MRDVHRRNSVFETEFRLTFSPIFRNDAMALVGSQGHHPVDHGLYLAKMWPRERTKVIAADLASRRRTTVVLSLWSMSVSVALLTLKMYRHSVSIFFLLI